MVPRFSSALALAAFFGVTPALSSTSASLGVPPDSLPPVGAPASKSVVVSYKMQPSKQGNAKGDVTIFNCTYFADQRTDPLTDTVVWVPRTLKPNIYDGKTISHGTMSTMVRRVGNVFVYIERNTLRENVVTLFDNIVAQQGVCVPDNSHSCKPAASPRAEMTRLKDRARGFDALIAKGCVVAVPPVPKIPDLFELPAIFSDPLPKLLPK
jgi:hypothetical protein